MRACPSCGTRQSSPTFSDGTYDLVTCAGCGVLYVVNPPSASELGRIYSFATGYHQLFEDDAAAIAFRESQAAARVRRLERFGGPGRVLDVGATAGFFVHAAVEAGWQAQGVELSPDTAALARSRYGVDVVCGTLSDVTIESGELDAITYWDVIEHVTEPRQELERAAELVKSGGRLAISTPNIEGWYPRASYHARHVIGGWSAVEPPFHLTQFGVRTLSQLLARTGWEVIDVKHVAQEFTYRFGSPREIVRSPKRLLYALAFAPLSLTGPLFGAGDEIIVVARRLA
jgi:2-polyprenyl-3-methyl-5-hydroxy-6-metoxy-1,4-benzoquinol methylase